VGGVVFLAHVYPAAVGIAMSASPGAGARLAVPFDQLMHVQIGHRARDQREHPDAADRGSPDPLVRSHRAYQRKLTREHALACWCAPPSPRSPRRRSFRHCLAETREQSHMATGGSALFRAVPEGCASDGDRLASNIGHPTTPTTLRMSVKS
jgi:hypothetical protein